MGGDDDLTFGQKASLKWAGFKKFMYNKEAGTVMGRDGKAWAQLIVFYTIFYLCLAAFWAAMLTVFLQTIDTSKPTWNSYVSTPAVAFAPTFKFEQIEYSLPWKEGSKEAKAITDQLDVIHKRLMNQPDTVKCNDTANTGDTQRFCSFDIGLLGEECVPPNYGFDKGTPCLYINLNKVWGWVPEAFEKDDMPEGVNITENHIAFSCRGEDEEDDEHLKGITFYPSDGISFGHYPYIVGTDREEQKRFVNPIVAVQFSLEFNTKVRITCMPHAANLKPLPGIYNSDHPVEFTVEFTITKEDEK